MKLKVYSFIAAVCLTSLAQAQEIAPSDILRYNDSDMNGSARFRGMSGAFGAVGGDLSALKINPAGSAVFNYNTAAFSLSYSNKTNKSNYLGNSEKHNFSDLDLGQMGVAFVFNSNNPNAVMRKFTIGLNFENTKNLKNDYFFVGNNTTSNLGEYFYDGANHGNNGHPIAIHDIRQIGNGHTNGYDNAGYYNGLTGQNTYLAYHSNLLTNNNGIYERNYALNSNSIQSRSNSSSGYTGNFSGNFGAQLGERFYVGTNLNIKTVDYTQYSEASEYIESPTATQTLRSTRFGNSIYTYGTGFSFNLGVIAKVTDNLRAGLAYESPTWYNLYDESSQYIQTTFTDKSSTTIAPNIINIYEKYKVSTPSRYTGSLAYVFGEKALISMDYTYKDYSNNKFKPTSDSGYARLNQSIAENMQGVSEVRVGGEYRLKAFSFRAGYRYEQSPYKTDKLVGDLQSFSTGIGYSFGPSRLDLSYSHSARDYKTSLLDLSNTTLYPTANMKLKENWVNLTYSINF